jgi:hypothetical protein
VERIASHTRQYLATVFDVMKHSCSWITSTPVVRR